jgi:hypothetical protein
MEEDSSGDTQHPNKIKGERPFLGILEIGERYSTEKMPHQGRCSRLAGTDYERPKTLIAGATFGLPILSPVFACIAGRVSVI